MVPRSQRRTTLSQAPSTTYRSPWILVQLLVAGTFLAVGVAGVAEPGGVADVVLFGAITIVSAAAAARTLFVRTIAAPGRVTNVRMLGRREHEVDSANPEVIENRFGLGLYVWAPMIHTPAGDDLVVTELAGYSLSPDRAPRRVERFCAAVRPTSA